MSKTGRHLKVGKDIFTKYINDFPESIIRRHDICTPSMLMYYENDNEIIGKISLGEEYGGENEYYIKSGEN